MRRAYFHIGFGKTGSSSIQAFLSQRTYLTGDGELLEYCAFSKQGQILRGEVLRQAALKSPLGYVASDPLVNTYDADAVRTAKEGIDKVFAEGRTPVFSQEDWGRGAGHFKQSRLFDLLDVDVVALAYVRPQVEWFNSGWWQWFAWDGRFTRPEDVVAAWGFNFMLWANQLSQWKRLDRVQAVIVRLQAADVVSDFLRVLGAQSEARTTDVGRVNVSLSAPLIKLLKRFPHLRGVNSAEVDAFLTEFFKFEGKTPWYVAPALQRSIIEACLADNNRLLQMLDPESRSIMADDQRWWDASAYKERRVWEETDFELSRLELEQFVEQAVPALLNLARQRAHAGTR